MTAAVETMVVATAHKFGGARSNLSCGEELRKTSAAG